MDTTPAADRTITDVHMRYNKTTNGFDLLLGTSDGTTHRIPMNPDDPNGTISRLLDLAHIDHNPDDDDLIDLLDGATLPETAFEPQQDKRPHATTSFEDYFESTETFNGVECGVVKHHDEPTGYMVDVYEFNGADIIRSSFFTEEIDDLCAKYPTVECVTLDDMEELIDSGEFGEEVNHLLWPQIIAETHRTDKTIRGHMNDIVRRMMMEMRA